MWGRKNDAEERSFPCPFVRRGTQCKCQTVLSMLVFDLRGAATGQAVTFCVFASGPAGASPEHASVSLTLVKLRI